MKKYFNIGLLSVFPILILIIGFSIRASQTFHFTILTDPVYFYLLNGLNFAQLKIVSGNFQHPGMPLQLLCGLIIKIIYNIDAKYSDVVTDVMHRPEYYISAINGTIYFLTAFIFFIAGFLIYKITNSLTASIFLQAIPFVDAIPFIQLTFMGPEKLILPLIMIMIVLLIWYIYNGFNKNIEIALIAIIIGLCIMQKFNMFPFVFIPFFILKGKMKKILYIEFLIITILILFVPLRHEIKPMYQYFFAMTTHSGMYGSGNSKIIDVSVIIPNFKILFSDHPATMYCLIILLLFLPFTFIKKLCVTPNLLHIRRVMWGIALAETLMVLLIIKHFKSHYLSPCIALTFLNLYLIIEYIKESKLIRGKYIFSAIYIFLIFFLLLINIPSFRSLYHWYDKQAANESSVIQLESQYKNMPKIILPRWYGATFEENAIFTGIFCSGNREQYCAKAKELYPNSYIYTTEWGTFDMGYNGFHLADILQKHKNFIINYYNDDTIVLKKFFQDMNEKGLAGDYSFKRLYFNSDLNNVIAELKNIKDTIIPAKIVFSLDCDMEQADYNLKNQTFINSKKCISNEVALSGKSSMKLNGVNEFGATTELTDFKKGDEIRASIWRFRNGNQSSLVISAENSQDFYFISKSVIETNSFWDLIEITVKIPDNIRLHKIKVYAWQNDKSSPAYFDDFKVFQYRNK